MLKLADILLIVATLVTTVLGLLIYLSGPRKKANRFLTASFGSVLLWMLANLATNLTASEKLALIFARSTLIGAALIPYFFLQFALEFHGFKSSYFRSLYLSLPVIGLLSLTPTTLNIKSVEPYGRNTQPGIAYLFLIVLYVLYFGVFTRLFLKTYKNKHSRAQIRSQSRLILLGLGFTLIPALLANGILPFFGLSEALYFGPSTMLAFVYFTTVAIVRHRLFSVRLVIARAVAYVSILAVLLGTYLLLAFQFANFMQNLTNIEFLGRLITFFTSILVALLYSPIKKFFDKLTNSLFYQDAYNPQPLIDGLNQVLVSNVDLKLLLSRSADIINLNLKSEFCMFYIRSTAYEEERTIGNGNRQDGFGDLSDLHALIPKVKRKVLSANEIYDNSEELQVQEILRKKNIELLARLVNTVDYEIEGIGYLFLGNKKSGSPYSKQDIKVLEIIANEMVIAIENVLRYEEIDKFNVTLQKKIDDATRELKRKNDKLRELDEAKDEFVSMASHQLRTPLTSIKGYVSMVAEEDVGKLNEEQKKMLSQALFSSQRMVYLIADLLNVSRLKTGKFVIETKPTYLPAVVDSEITQLTEGAAAKDITLIFDKPAKFPMLNLDEMKIRQVIMNFTDNAIYYTPSGGRITISLKDKKDTVEFTVKDTGIGVPLNERHKLFTKFYRANNARRARPDGTGLGLFMAKKVVVAQGGSIIFDSKEGKGSTFGFSFPKERLEVASVRSGGE